MMKGMRSAMNSCSIGKTTEALSEPWMAQRITCMGAEGRSGCVWSGGADWCGAGAEQVRSRRGAGVEGHREVCRGAAVQRRGAECAPQWWRSRPAARGGRWS